MTQKSASEWAKETVNKMNNYSFLPKNNTVLGCEHVGSVDFATWENMIAKALEAFAGERTRELENEKEEYFEGSVREIKARDAQIEELQATVERMAWNLGGCSTYAMGCDLAGGHDKEMALPALEDVLKLSLKYRDAQASLKKYEEVVDAAKAVNQLALEKKIIDTNKSGLQGLEMLNAALHALENPEKKGD